MRSYTAVKAEQEEKCMVNGRWIAFFCAAIVVASFSTGDMTALADEKDGIFDDKTGEAVNGWYVEDGKSYWYEDGIRQGVKYNVDGTIDEAYRGKEIYDSDSDAWYWLDNVQNGAKTVSKDVYMESLADAAGTIGKWVRYDENGQMIKGWDTNEDGTWYFDMIYGSMAKGAMEIDGITYIFNESTGVLETTIGKDTTGFVTISGKDYWYEDGVRQGVKYNEDGSIDLSYRGKEIYDPETDAWYWLDNIQNGAKAVSKDIYMESQADDKGNIGKWVRYDAEGRMVKGWDTNDAGTYYFDSVYGTMYKWLNTIDGDLYCFDEKTGVRYENRKYIFHNVIYTFGPDGKGTYTIMGSGNGTYK